LNTARLVAGWFFLMGLTAAGTYYATDEVDQRVSLSKFNIYEKLGVTKYATASVPIPSVPVNPGQVNPPVVVNPPLSPVNPPANQVTPTPGAVGYLQPQQPNNSQTQPQYQQPVNPPQNIPQPGVQPRVNQQPSYQPPGQQRQQIPSSNQMPADYAQARTRLTSLQGQAQAEAQYWEEIKKSLASMHQPLRPEISAALGTLNRATAQADQSLRGGDTGTARQLMDLAEKQIQILNKAKE
jgi:hypothetical protein